MRSQVSIPGDSSRHLGRGTNPSQITFLHTKDTVEMPISLQLRSVNWGRDRSPWRKSWSLGWTCIRERGIESESPELLYNASYCRYIQLNRFGTEDEDEDDAAVVPSSSTLMPSSPCSSFLLLGVEMFQGFPYSWRIGWLTLPWLVLGGRILPL